MELVVIYSIAFTVLILLYPLRWLLRLFVQLFLCMLLPTSRLLSRTASRLRILFSYRLYALVWDRRYWMSITHIEFLTLSLYVCVNAAVLYLGRENVAGMAGMLATINATPLFLGGRTNPIADFFGVPLSSYYIFHHFIGRVVFAEGLLHAAILLRRSRFDQLSISGYIASGGLLLIFCTSFWFIRRYLYRSFGKMHLVLALAALAGMTWHALLLDTARAKIPVILAGSVWTLTAIYRLLRLVFHSTGASIETEPIVESQVSRIDVHCDRPTRVFPGSYFYIFPEGKLLHYDLFSSYPIMAMWYSPMQDSPTSKVKDITFLVSHLSRPLRSVRFAKGQNLLLDGPYGQDLTLQQFDTVMLAAKGAGILGLLPIALTALKNRIRKINILWQLEESSQVKWIVGELKVLQALDAENELFAFWCIFPSKEGDPGFQTSEYWRCFYKVNIDLYLHSMIEASSGESVVVVCGDAEFSSKVRYATISRMRANRPLKFIEAQYRPNRTISAPGTDDAVGDEERNARQPHIINKLIKEKDLEEVDLDSPQRSSGPEMDRKRE